MANINFHNVSKEEKLLRQAYTDMIAFGKLFLPQDYMRSETPWFHYQIADKVDDKSIKQLAVIMPRGHGKTVLTKCDILKSFCFGHSLDMLKLLSLYIFSTTLSLSKICYPCTFSNAVIIISYSITSTNRLILFCAIRIIFYF